MTDNEETFDTEYLDDFLKDNLPSSAAQRLLDGPTDFSQVDQVQDGPDSMDGQSISDRLRGEGSELKGGASAMPMHFVSQLGSTGHGMMPMGSLGHNVQFMGSSQGQKHEMIDPHAERHVDDKTDDQGVNSFASFLNPHARVSDDLPPHLKQGNASPSMTNIGQRSQPPNLGQPVNMTMSSFSSGFQKPLFNSSPVKPPKIQNKIKDAARSAQPMQMNGFPSVSPFFSSEPSNSMQEKDEEKSDKTKDSNPGLQPMKMNRFPPLGIPPTNSQHNDKRMSPMNGFPLFNQEPNSDHKPSQGLSNRFPVNPMMINSEPKPNDSPKKSTNGFPNVNPHARPDSSNPSEVLGTRNNTTNQDGRFPASMNNMMNPNMRKNTQNPQQFGMPNPFRTAHPVIPANNQPMKEGLSRPKIVSQPQSMPPAFYPKRDNYPPNRNQEFQRSVGFNGNFLSGSPRDNPNTDIPPHLLKRPRMQESNTIHVKLICKPQNTEFTMKVQKDQVRTVDTLLRSLEAEFKSGNKLGLYHADGMRQVVSLDELESESTFILDDYKETNSIVSSGMNSRLPHYDQGIHAMPQNIPYDHYGRGSQAPAELSVDPSYRHLLERTPPLACLTEKLPASKTPVIDSFVYCALCGWGATITYADGYPIEFSMSNFTLYWEYQMMTCSKPSPTREPVSRLKSLRRWFNDFPGIKKLKAIKNAKVPLTFGVRQDRKNDMRAMVKKISQIVNTRCRAASTQYQPQNTSHLSHLMPATVQYPTPSTSSSPFNFQM